MYLCQENIILWAWLVHAARKTQMSLTTDLLESTGLLSLNSQHVHPGPDPRSQ